MTYPIHYLGGQGILGHVLTGLVRIPALMANIVAVGIASELALRTLRGVASTIGFKPTRHSRLMKAAQKMSDYNFRPFEEKRISKHSNPLLSSSRAEAAGTSSSDDDASLLPGQATTNSTKQLVGNLIVATAISVAGTEFVRIIGGPPHSVYGSLAFFGPLRLSSQSYWEGISPLLGRVSAFFNR